MLTKVKPKMKIKIYSLILITVFLITSGLGCRCTSEKVKEASESITLNYWTVLDNQDDFGKIINDFRLVHPNVVVNVRKFYYEEYAQALLEAWAIDKGPDIFSIPNTWMTDYRKYIIPMPAVMELPFTFEQGTIKKEKVTEIRKINGLTRLEIRKSFIDIVEKDIFWQNQIYGLPLAVDNLVLYYNRDLLNNAGIADSADNWTDFAQQVKKLTLEDGQGKIIQSGVALGTSNNINNYFDLLSLLMIQGGASMMNEQGQAIFNSPLINNKSYFPGQEALRFYTDFANPIKEVYSWNQNLPNAFESFIQGKSAFYFGYSYHLPLIKARAPKLNFDLAPVPQIADSLRTANYANYWIETVSKKTEHSDVAWGFLKFATDIKNVPSYLDQTKKPTALRGLIKQQLINIDLRSFAQQLLTSHSWYQGNDYQSAQQIFSEMIDAILTGRYNDKNNPYQESINQAVRKINQLL